MASLPPVFKQRYFTASGAPLVGGKIYTYQAGTTTPLPSYTDNTETFQNANPTILDANGECDMWLGSRGYKVVLTDASDVVQWTMDNVRSVQGGVFESIQPMTTKGDLITHTGVESTRFPVGTDDQVLTADSADTVGLTWKLPHPLTAKGDLFTRGSAIAARLPVGLNGQVLTADSAESTGLKWAAASGGGGAENYITNPNAEIDTTGWTLNNITPAPFPSGALLGSPAGLTLTRSTSTPLNGTAEFQLEKDGSNRQGQLLLTNFTVPPKSRAKVLSIRFPYRVLSGTFINDTSKDTASLGVYIREFDGTNYTWTEPSSWRFLSNSTTISDEFRAEFQTLSTTISADLVFYVGAFATGAWTLEFDDVNVGPSQYIYGTPFSDAETRTFTLTNAGNATVVGTVSRAAQRAVFSGTITIGSTLPTGSITLNYPSGYSSSVTSGYLDAAITGLRGTTAYHGTASATSASSVIFSGPNTATWSATVPATWVAGDTIKFDIEAPISGWSSSVQMSDSTSTRVVSFSGTQSTQAVTANTTNIAFTANSNKTGAWNGTQFVVDAPGDYVASASWTSSVAANGGVWLNGTQVPGFFSTASAAGITTGSLPLFDLKSGDLISFRNNGTGTITAGVANVFRLSGPSAIAASERIRLRYSCSTSPTINNTTPTLTYDVRRYDTHVAYVGNEFKPPRADFYTFRGCFQTASHTTTLNFLTSLQVFVDGVLVSHLASFVAGTVNACRRTAQGTASLFLTTDNVVTFRFYSDTSTTLSSVVEANWIEVEGG